MKAWLISILCFVGSNAYSHQPKQGQIHASLGPYLYQTYLEQSYPGLKSNRLLGLGLNLMADVDKNGGIEAGMFYMHKLFFRKSGDKAIVEKVKRMYITLGYRHWFNAAFSFAGAFFSSYLMGDPVIVHSDFSPRSSSPATSALDEVDYGLDLSLQWEFVRKPDYSLIADLRYSLTTTARASEDADHRAIFIAYKKRVQ